MQNTTKIYIIIENIDQEEKEFKKSNYSNIQKHKILSKLYAQGCGGPKPTMTMQTSLCCRPEI